ncbi:MAG: hypothetical protein QXY39_01740 [Thermofilaceae archaeon]
MLAGILRSAGIEVAEYRTRTIRIVRDTAVIMPCSISYEYHPGMTVVETATCNVALYVASGSNPHERVKRMLELADTIASMVAVKSMSEWQLIAVDRKSYTETYRHPGYAVMTLTVRLQRWVLCSQT